MTKEIPQSFKDIRRLLIDLFQNGSTFEDYKELREWCFTNQEFISGLIGKMTIPELNHYARKDKKPKMVDSVLDSVLSSFTIGDSIQWTMGEKYSEVLKKIAYSTTEEKFLAYKAKRQEERDKKKKALENPETLEEFRTFIHYKGEAALSTEQKIVYDELMTGTIKSRKEQDAERAAKVTAVSINDVDLLIQETVHTKKGHALWVVKLSEYVDRSIFLELKDRAQSLGGYYSSYRGNGAIPGFTFTKKEGAELFVAIKDGDVNAHELRKAINAEKQLQRAENLEAKADNMEERATESLNQDRKDNTVRRARMATNAERQATANLLFAQTMESIAQEMKDGSLLYLNRLGNITQLEELYSILSSCKYRYMRANNIREDDYEFKPEVIDFAEIPYPVLYNETHTLILLKNLSLDKGKLLAANRMMKRLARVKDGDDYIIREGGPMDDYEKLFTWPSKHLDNWAKDRFKSMWLRYKRIVSLGITTIFELRTALRELVRIKDGIKLTPEQIKLQQVRELERKFVARRIDGFFPTPEALGGEVVEYAHIEPQHTICEPQAGLGHIADIIAERYPDNELLCIEQYQPLHEALVLKGFNAINEDFLKYEQQKFDRIIMNPPFENDQDIIHFKHAMTLLNPGGRIVAIMCDNKTEDNNNIRRREFFEFMENECKWHKNPAGSFMSAFRPTGVNTITVIYNND